MGKVIGNVVILDITSATEESVKDIERIDNVVTVLYSEKTKNLLPMLNIGNLVGSFEVTEDYIPINGNLFIDINYFKGLKNPVFLLINGEIMISNDVTVDDIDNGITGMVVNGKVLCPKSLAGILQSKAKTIDGSVETYEDNYTLYNNNLDIDELFLKSLESNAKLAVTGTIKLAADVDKNLLKDKIGSLQVLDKIIVKEDYLDILSAKLLKKDAHIEVVPTSFEYIEKDLNLDKLNIKKYNNAKLYVNGNIKFADDVTEDALKNSITSIIAKGNIICKKDLYEYLVGICQNDADILTYENKPLFIEGDYKLTAQQLKYYEDKITPFVYGLLNIDKDVLEDIFAEKIDAIYNYGQITCSKDIYGLVKFKIRVNNGELTEVSEEEPPKKDEEKYHGTNAVVLKL